MKLIAGGSWFHKVHHCRSGNSDTEYRDYDMFHLGFRVVSWNRAKILGGSYYHGSEYCAIGYERTADPSSPCYINLGFRVVKCKKQ